MELGESCPLTGLWYPFLLNKRMGLAILCLETPVAIEEQRVSPLFKININVKLNGVLTHKLIFMYYKQKS